MPTARPNLSVDTTSIAEAWVQRRSEALQDAGVFAREILSGHTPFDVLRAQQLWASNAFLRLIEDTTACQTLAERMIGRAVDWTSAETENVAARMAAASSRAVPQPLRDAGD